MDKEELKLILKSDIIKSEKVMEDFEYTFLDIKQVIKRIDWLEEELNAIFQIKGTEMDEQEEIVDKIREAFKEIQRGKPNSSQH